MTPALQAKLPTVWDPPDPDPHWFLDPGLAASLQYCRLATKKHAKSFYFCSFRLPPHKRSAAYAVYAFCRYVDDLLDRSSRESRPDSGFLPWLQNQLASIEAGTTTLPFAPAFAAANRVFQIDRNFYVDLIRGCCLDERPARMADFEELEVYCYHVASVVGLMMSRIFGLRLLEGVHRAVDMGIAMQLTNILRDIGEDWRNGRLYLPANELAAAGLDEGFIEEGRVNDQWRAFMAAQIERARNYYRSASEGLPLLADDGSRFTARLMATIYGQILDEIERADFDVFKQRVYVPFWRKVVLTVQSATSRN